MRPSPTDSRARRPARRRWIAAAGLLVLIAALAGLVAFRSDLLLSDLAPTEPPARPDAGPFLAAMAAVHGDPAAWHRLPPIDLELRGEVPFLPARLAFGLDGSDVELKLRFWPAEHGRYEIELRQGEAVQRGPRSTVPERDRVGLLLDSVRHLFELPLGAHGIPVQRALPALEGPGGRLERAFFTWGTDTVATPAHDQIILWTRAGRLTRMDTTGRDIAPFIVARVEFEGAVTVGGFELPRSASVYDDGPGGGLVHRWELRSASLASTEPGPAPPASPG